MGVASGLVARRFFLRCGGSQAAFGGLRWGASRKKQDRRRAGTVQGAMYVVKWAHGNHRAIHSPGILRAVRSEPSAVAPAAVGGRADAGFPRITTSYSRWRMNRTRCGGTTSGSSATDCSAPRIQALRKLLADPMYLGAEPGLLAALPTWDQTLLMHPHS